MSEPPAELLALDRSDLEQLVAAVRALPDHPPFWEADLPERARREAG
jgi:hypothetical protein